MTQSVADSSRRLSSIAEAKRSLDTAAATYAQSCGLILQQQSAAESAQQYATPVVDASVLEKFTQEQRLLATMQHQTLANYLNVNSSGNAEVMELEKLHSRDPHAMLVSRWCAKEAIFKSLGVKSKGAGAPMKDIEVWNDEKGSPRVRLTGAAAQSAEDSGIANGFLSVSYGDDEVVAVAVSVRM